MWVKGPTGQEFYVRQTIQLGSSWGATYSSMSPIDGVRLVAGSWRAELPALF